MPRLLYNFSIVILLFSLTSVQANTIEEGESYRSRNAEETFVYYFHYSRRCATCMAIEDVSKTSLQELYPEKVKSGTVVFLSVNLDESDNKELADQLKVSGQALLVVMGDKQVDLTNQAFLYANTKPEKLKAEIASAIEQL